MDAEIKWYFPAGLCFLVDAVIACDAMILLLRNKNGYFCTSNPNAMSIYFVFDLNELKAQRFGTFKELEF